MKCKKVVVTVFGALLAVMGSSSTHAESRGSDQWNFQLATYGWLAGQKGTMATLPGLPPADIDVDFYDDILGNIEGAFFLLGEARKGRFGIVIDMMYGHVKMEEPTPLGVLYSAVSSRTEYWMVSGLALYRLLESQDRFLDLIGGIRYWDFDLDLTLKGPQLPSLREQSIANKESWVDPIVGVKGFMPIGESKFFVSGAFVIGGFQVGSDFMWDALINFGYQWTKSFSTTIGYRYMDVNYEDDGFLYDVAQQGITLGLSWRF